MTTPEIIEACAKIIQRPFLVIGGHAVIAYGHSRNTVDIDLLARKDDRASWVEGLTALAYESRHTHENFEQFRSTKGDSDLDLMFVSDSTFAGLIETSKEVVFGPVSVRIPSLQHLIALKLHVLKQGLEHRMLGDFDDVVQLVLVNRIDLENPEWKSLFDRYGNEELYERARRATKSS
jgi:predicted nucleotidyltransferase